MFVFDRFLCFFISLSVSFFLSLLARLRENSWTDLHEIFREGLEWPWDDLITFLVNSEKPRDVAMCNMHGDGVCCAFAPQLVNFYVQLTWTRFFLPNCPVHPCHTVPNCPLLHFLAPFLTACRFVHSRKFHQPALALYLAVWSCQHHWHGVGVRCPFF